jgi:hypothetical protein
MLPERYRELLTAFVDGELSTRQRKGVLRLLHKSAEARQLLRELQADADLVRGLPRWKLGADFPLQVMQAIAERALQPGGQVAASRTSGWPAWTGWAAAAAVLLSVSALSYFAFPLFTAKGRHEPALVRNDTDSSKVIEKRKKPPVEKVIEPRERRQVARAPKRKQPDKPETVVKTQQKDRTAVKDRKNGRKRPPKKQGEPEALTFGGITELPPLAKADVSFMEPLQNLTEKTSTDKLRAKLSKDTAYRVDLLCRHSGRGLDQLRRAFAGHGIQMVVDQKAQARLRNPRLKTKYLLYGENLHPAEVVDIFRQLGQADAAANLKRKGSEQFTMLVVQSLAPVARQRLAQFLGVPPVRKKAKGKPTKGKVPDDTMKIEPQMATTKKGPAPSSGSKPVGSRPGRFLLVLAYNENDSPVHPQVHLSREVKRFRGLRHPVQPGTLQVVFVLSRDPA